MFSNHQRNHSVDSTWLNKYSHLFELPETQSILTYIWVDAFGGLRSKIKVVNSVPKTIHNVPLWAIALDFFYNSDKPLGYEVSLQPIRLYHDPFGGINDRLVWCELRTFDENAPIEANSRFSCDLAAGLATKHEPIFMIEQEYTMMDGNRPRVPYGWPSKHFPDPDAPYYCGVGANTVSGRDIAEAHYRACIYAGINISGQEMGQVLGTCKYQIGPNHGITIGDDLWISRYILQRVAEQFYIQITFDPWMFRKPGTGSWIQFQSKTFESDKFEATKAKDRLIAKNYTYNFRTYPSQMEMRYNRNVPNVMDQVKVISNFEKPDLNIIRCERLPSNIDPYVVCEDIIRTICLNE